MSCSFWDTIEKLFLNIGKKIMHQWKCRLKNIALRGSICDVFTNEGKWNSFAYLLTNQNSSKMTNQNVQFQPIRRVLFGPIRGQGGNFIKESRQAHLQFPSRRVWELLIWMKFLLPHPRLGIPVDIRWVAANFCPQTLAKESSWELMQNGILEKKNQNVKGAYDLFSLHWIASSPVWVKDETFKTKRSVSTCYELPPDKVGSWGWFTSDSVTKSLKYQEPRALRAGGGGGERPRYHHCHLSLSKDIDRAPNWA